MQDGDLAPGVPLWRRHIEVNGVARAASSMSWDGELSSDMPDAIGGVTGIQARTGRIAWAPQTVVESVPPSPWSRRSGWPPSPGDRIDIWVGDDDTSWKVFTGRIDKTTGDVDSLVSTIVDDSDRLNRPISIEPVAYQMPGMMQSNGIYREYAPVYVRPWYAMYKCLRLGGWGVSAPSGSQGLTVLSVDMQGSLYPDIGTVGTSSNDVDLQYGPGFTYLAGGYIRYEPRAHAALASGSGVRVWLRWTGGQRAYTSVLFSDGRSVQAEVTRLSNGTTTLYLFTTTGGLRSDRGTVIAESTITLNVEAADGSQWIELFFQNGTQTVRYTVPSAGVAAGAPNGSAEGTFTHGSIFNAATTMALVTFGGPAVAARVGNLTLTQWRGFSAHTQGSRVNLWGGGLGRLQRIQRTIENRPAADVLAEAGRATLTSMWLDETSTMQVAPSDVLYAQRAMHTVTTAQDIFALGWEESIQATRRMVHVDYQEVVYSYMRREKVLLYQPSSAAQLDGGGVVYEDFIKPDGDSEWIWPDTTLQDVNGHEYDFNNGNGSFYGASFDNSNGVNTWGRDLTVSLEKLGLRTLKFSISTSRSTEMELSTPDDAESLFPRRRDEPLPLIRGYGLVTLADAVKDGASTGPSWAPDLTHELDYWGRADDAQRIADWLSERLATPLITLTNLEVAYDPRIQLGDVLLVDSETFMGFSAEVLVIGKAESHDGAESTLTLTVRVVRTMTTYATYEAFEAAYQGRNYAALESAWAGARYIDMERKPLEGGA